jgi:hypothetical protein
MRWSVVAEPFYPEQRAEHKWYSTGKLHQEKKEGRLKKASTRGYGRECPDEPRLR